MGVRVYTTTGTRDLTVAQAMLEEAKKEIEKSAGGRVKKKTRSIVKTRGVPPQNHTYMYCLKSGAFVKIGLADRPDERAAILSLGNPYGIEIVETWALPRSVSKIIEMAIHRRLSEHAVGREWFKATPEMAKRAVEAYDAEMSGNAKPEEFKPWLR